jgi:ribosomal protein L6P/L9E
MIVGVTNGFEKQLGIWGYWHSCKPDFDIAARTSHPIAVEAPEGLI